MPFAINITDLKKNYGKLQALKGIDLQIKRGDFFALLGPNGAGKSTTINVICSLVKKDSGSVEICGDSLDTHPSLAKAHIGIVPQEFNCNIFETPLQILVHQAGFYGIPRKIALKRAEKNLKALKIWDKRNVKSARLSGGMKRRLMIARALMHDPEVLILDEPTAGVDIEIRASIWELVSKLNKEGKTILLTTHYLEEAENLCKNIAIIDEGKIIENTTIKNITRRVDELQFIIDLQNPIKGRVLKGDFSLTKLDETTLEATLGPKQNIYDLFDHLRTLKYEVMDIRKKSNRLEQLFLKLTKKSINPQP